MVGIRRSGFGFSIHDIRTGVASTPMAEAPVKPRSFPGRDQFRAAQGSASHSLFLKSASDPGPRFPRAATGYTAGPASPLRTSSQLHEPIASRSASPGRPSLLDRLRALFTRPSDLERCRKGFNAALDSFSFLADNEREAYKSNRSADPDGTRMKRGLADLRERVQTEMARASDKATKLAARTKELRSRLPRAEGETEIQHARRDADRQRQLRSAGNEMREIKWQAGVLRLNLLTLKLLEASARQT